MNALCAHTGLISSNTRWVIDYLASCILSANVALTTFNDLKAATLYMYTISSDGFGAKIANLGLDSNNPGFTCVSSVAGMGQMWVNTGLLSCVKHGV